MDPDTTNTADPIQSAGLDFADLITGDLPETPAAETPAAETPEVPAAETPAPETPIDDEDNPFKTEKKDDPKPTEEEIPEKPASKDHWDTLRASRDRHKTAAEEKAAILVEKEARISELEAKAARVAELEDRMRLFEEQEKELALARVESTLEYKQNIDAPLKAIGEQAEILTTSNDSDVAEVKRMLIEADPAKQRALLKEITSGWDEIDRMDLRKMAEDARVLLDKQEAMRANAHAASKEQSEIATKRETEQKELARKEFAKAAGDAAKSIREKLPFSALFEGETEDDRYSVLAQKVAQVDLDTQTPRAKALAIASTLAMPKAIQTIGQRDAEIATLKAALAKALDGKPSVETKTDATQDSKELDYFDAMGVPQPRAMFGT